MTDLHEAHYYNNRELSWLQFNTRVLKQAQNSALPPLERLKFLAIYGTNLDEFYMIRVAGLKKLFNAGINVSGADCLTPLQQLKEVRSYLHQELQVVEHIKREIFEALEHEGLTLKRFNDVSSSDQKKLHEYFYDEIYHVIVPIAVDATHPFPHLNNLSFGLLLKLADAENPDIHRYGIVRIPRALPRFVEIRSGVFILIESIVSEHIQDLFPGYELISDSSFRVTRNADLEIEEEEADDFMEMLEEGLKLRKKGELVRLELGRGANDDLIAFFNRHANIFPDDIYRFRTFLNLGSLWQIVGTKDFAHLLLPTFKPRILPPLNETDSIYAALDKQDIMLFHPYYSFEPVIKMIQTAAKDPAVVAIKMTLYRVGSDSPLVRSLVQAAELGKQVTVMVELKARFDEENNVQWAKALENAGAHVIYGIRGFKVHAKALLITRRVNGKLKQYAHIGTGNYNAATAKIYTDISYMTSNIDVTNDMTRFFHFLTGFSKKGMLNKLYMAPTQIKPKILSLIEQEISHTSQGHIIAKINALVDEDVIRMLYRASQAGVKIELIVRGICGLKPGIEGVSDNIRVVSIVGKYLEHARIFYFKHATPQLYISSADWMTRNLSRRIELLSGIESEDLAERLRQILKLQLSDNVLAHELQSDGNYIKVPTDMDNVIDSQNLIEKHVSKINAAANKEHVSQIDQLSNRFFEEN